MTFLSELHLETTRRNISKRETAPAQGGYDLL